MWLPRGEMTSSQGCRTLQMECNGSSLPHQEKGMLLIVAGLQHALFYLNGLQYASR